MEYFKSILEVTCKQGNTPNSIIMEFILQV